MKILLIGHQGKMGLQMQGYLTQNNIEFVGVDKDNINNLKQQNFDVVLDFSTSEALLNNLKIAKDFNVPIVIATTNHSKQNLQYIHKFKNYIPIFMSSNFSMLFNLMLKMVGCIKANNSNEIIVQEVHHKTKKDKPSGSLKQIIKTLNMANIKPKMYCYRVADVVGKHSVFVYSNGEVLEIKHTAYTKQIFCQGALNVCEYILKQKNGLYSMENYINDCL